MHGKYHAPSMEGGHAWVFLNGACENSDNFSVDSPHRIISLNNVAWVWSCGTCIEVVETCELTSQDYLPEQHCTGVDLYTGHAKSDTKYLGSIME